MIEYTYYKQSRQVASGTEHQVRNTLLEHLEAYDDAIPDIQRYSNDAMDRIRKQVCISFTTKNHEKCTLTASFSK